LTVSPLAITEDEGFTPGVFVQGMTGYTHLLTTLRVSPPPLETVSDVLSGVIVVAGAVVAAITLELDATVTIALELGVALALAVERTVLVALADEVAGMLQFELNAFQLPPSCVHRCGAAALICARASTIK